MRVFVAGGSGLVGLGVVRALVARGHQVIAQHATKEKAAQLQALGAQPHHADLMDPAAYEPARDVDAIIQCAQPPIVGKRLSAKVIQEISDFDRITTQRLLEAGAGRAKTFIYSSGYWVYGDHGEDVVSETTEPRPLQVAQHKLRHEQMVFSEGKRLGYTSAVAMRAGSVYGAGGTFEAFVIGPMRKGQAARYVGSGNQWISYIHADDCGEAYALAVEKSPGFIALNVVDDEPVRARESLAWLAAQMGAKPPGGAPKLLVQVFAGAVAPALAASLRVQASKTKELLGWQPRHRSFQEGVVEFTGRGDSQAN